MPYDVYSERVNQLDLTINLLKKFSDDLKKNIEVDIQKLTDDFVKNTEELLALKEKEIMTV